MFRIAKCEDLVRLKFKHGDLLPQKHMWGLKHMGYLFTVDILKNRLLKGQWETHDNQNLLPSQNSFTNHGSLK